MYTADSFNPSAVAPRIKLERMHEQSHKLKLIPWAAAQLEVEKHFLATTTGINTTTTKNYWMGIRQVGRTWYMLDGTVLNNGVPSNADPYAHW
jgi:hypothetical protein